jgi:proline iminopeptidase
MATTIDAPPEDVWPWLAQMGYGRAGWYSWDRLDNFGERSAGEIHPEWQEIHLGDFLGPQEGVTSRAWAVAALEPGRFLGLRASFDLRRGRWFDPTGTPPPFSTDSLWGFLLEPLPGGKTRLVVSGYWAFRPRWLQPIMSVLFLEPEHWIMQMRQFRNLKRLAEGAARRPAAAVTADPPITVAAGRG